MNFRYHETDFDTATDTTLVTFLVTSKDSQAQIALDLKVGGRRTLYIHERSDLRETRPGNNSLDPVEKVYFPESTERSAVASMLCELGADTAEWDERLVKAECEQYKPLGQNIRPLSARYADGYFLPTHREAECLGAGEFNRLAQRFDMTFWLVEQSRTFTSPYFFRGGLRAALYWHLRDQGFDLRNEKYFSSVDKAYRWGGLYMGVAKSHREFSGLAHNIDTDTEGIIELAEFRDGSVQDLRDNKLSADAYDEVTDSGFKSVQEFNSVMFHGTDLSLPYTNPSRWGSIHCHTLGFELGGTEYRLIILTVGDHLLAYAETIDAQEHYVTKVFTARKCDDARERLHRAVIKAVRESHDWTDLTPIVHDDSARNCML